MGVEALPTALPVYVDRCLAGHVIVHRDGQIEAVRASAESLGRFNHQDAAVAALIRRAWQHG
jgi:hypothetical protein